MRIALCTTTIHVPHALKLMRKCDPNARFFVALDEKSAEIPVELDTELPTHCLWMPPASQKKWKCSEAIGWNCIQRRNIAFLEALKFGADVVVSWDTDNAPLSLDYFQRFGRILTRRFDGLLGSSKQGWFDAGQLLAPFARQRGIPYDNAASHHYDIVTNYRAGVAAGLVIGNPDIDATTRMEKAPEIHNVSELAKQGVLVDVNTHTVFNTQSTAMIRDLVPAWFLMPGVGRHDDLYASLIVQRVARERGLHVHFGYPLVWQERHKHDQLADLRAEIDGMSNIRKLATLLDHIVIPHGWTVVDDTRKIYETLLHCEFLPRASVEAGLLWLEDCKGLGL